MAKILLIETSTALCSVAFEQDGVVLASRESDKERAHASLTAVFCDEVLKECGFVAKDLDAVCFSDGPGSYTGLRVGLSTAKGLCFGARVKLLSVSSLDVLAAQGAGLLGDLAQEYASIRTIVPMIDARRMEVYTALYDRGGARISDIEAKVVDSGSFVDMAAEALFIGDGALKCKDVIGSGVFVNTFPKASQMASLAENAFEGEAWRDVAYFEPFYLKDYVPTTSGKRLF